MIKKMKIATKLISGFVLVALIAAYIGFTGYRSVLVLNDGSKNMYQNMVIPLEQTQTITELFQRVRVNLRDMIHAETKERIEYFIKRTEGIIKDIDKTSKQFEKRILGSRMRKTYNHFLEMRKEYHKYIKRIYELARQNKDDEAYKILLGEGLKAANNEKEAIGKLTEYKVEDAKTLYHENLKAGASAELQVIIFGIIGFIAAILLGFFLARSISKPLIEGVSFANNIATKDLTRKLDPKLLERLDEIGILSQALDKMQENLTEIMSEMNDVASNLAASAEEISSSSQSMAEGAQNQSASVEETSASIEELSSSVTQVSGNADEVKVKSQELLGTAEESSVLVENAVTGMNKINESSQQISEILTVINDIADQTNLLALNAAIEAARAGEHGRGFAVVADEISKLADKSTENAKEIEKLIKQSMKDVADGADIVQRAGDAFNQIISGINENNKLVEGITDAVSQQKDGAQQVATAIENINDVTQSVSASAEEMAASTEELQSQAEKIAIMVGDFKLNEETSDKEKALELHSD